MCVISVMLLLCDLATAGSCHFCHYIAVISINIPSLSLSLLRSAIALQILAALGAVVEEEWVKGTPVELWAVRSSAQD